MKSLLALVIDAASAVTLAAAFTLPAVAAGAAAPAKVDLAKP